MRRKSQKHESQKLSDDLDWESTWNKRSLMNDDEPELPMFGQKHFTDKTAPNTPNPKDGDIDGKPRIEQEDNIAMIPCVEVSVNHFGQTLRTTSDTVPG